MYPLKRMAAYVIDYFLLFPLSAYALTFLEGRLEGLFKLGEDEMQRYVGLLNLAFSLGIPVLVLGTLTGLTGRTPGKLVMFLRVVDHGGDPPGIDQGILREVIKVVSMSFLFLGAFWALQGLVTRHRTFYDEWLDLDVEDLRPSGLTPVQKNFRKYMREQARKNRSR